MDTLVAATAQRAARSSTSYTRRTLRRRLRQKGLAEPKFRQFQGHPSLARCQVSPVSSQSRESLSLCTICTTDARRGPLARCGCARSQEARDDGENAVTRQLSRAEIMGREAALRAIRKELDGIGAMGAWRLDSVREEDEGL